MSDVAISVSDLRKTFGAVQAVRNVSFEIPRGQVTAFLGPNGAGKTTTLDMILGLSPATSGTIKVFGMSPRKAVISGHVSAVLQTGGLLMDHTIESLVKMVAGTFPQHLPVEEVMERADLTKIAKRKIRQCSGGEQQRVRFALALLPNPELIILDEPTTGMDVTARRHFWEVMHAQAERGTTVLFATHYLAEAEMFAERTIIMSNGQIVADGPLSDIRASFGDQQVIGRFASEEEARAAASSIPGATQDFTSVTVSEGDVLELNRAMLAQPGLTGISVTDLSLEDAFTQLTSATDNEE